jgi:solute carrier family 25 (mitochondrial 2-oxodicarboxylate transporter), member 21
MISDRFGRLYKGLVPPLLLEAPKRPTKCQQSRPLELPLNAYRAFWIVAANDFWGKTFKKYSGQSTMTLGLSTFTGCSAGATESFVVRIRSHGFETDGPI